MAKKNPKDPAPAVRNIFLTGFMCAGKTSAGKLLARALGRPLADSDALAEKKAGRSVSWIVEKRGLAAFRELEAACVKELAAGRGRVIALGGGVYPSRRWKTTLAAAGITVFLHCPWPELEKRLKPEAGTRPLLKGAWAAAGPRAKKLYSARLRFYRRADITIDTRGLTPAQTAAKIKKAIKL
jgi:shikimate kinase